MTEDLTDVSRRDALAESVLKLVRGDERVASAEVVGSLSSGHADEYSDIDIHVDLCTVSDRAFAEVLPDLLRPIGPCVIAGWGLKTLPEQFVRTFYFADYPLFWHVDVRCESALHVDGSDLKDTYHWPQIFKMWIDELTEVLRGAGSTGTLDEVAGRWTDLSELPTEPRGRLSALLDLADDRARARGAPCDEMFARCDELRKTYLERR
jgi:hypothetical protein